MKKFLVTLLVAMLALTCVAFAADEVVAYKDHEATHATLVEGKDWELLKLDCTETGVCRHFLADNKYVDYILAPTGHYSETLPGEGEIVTEPDCTNKGVEKVVCDNIDPVTGKKCGETFERKIDTTSHVLDFYWVKAPTCSTYGILAYGCPACDYVVEGELYTYWKNAHLDADGKIEIDGVTYKRDNACDKYVGDDVKKHTNLSGWLTISEDDCYNPLVKENYCRDCQTTIRFWEEKVDHKWSTTKKAVQMNSANCKTPAVYANVEYCSRCDIVKFLNPVADLNTTGVGTGYFDYGATGNAKIDAAIAAAAAKYTDKNYGTTWTTASGVLTTDLHNGSSDLKYWFYANYEGSGVWTKGHHVVTEKSVVKVNDDALELITCKDQGNEKLEPVTETNLYIQEDYYCAVCKTEIAKTVRTAIAAPAHDYTAWKEVVAPTEDTNFIGKWTRYCLECSKYEEYIGGVCGKDNHLEDEPVLENVVEATYTAEGSAEEVIYCAVCKEELSRTEIVLPMLEGINPEDGILYEDGKASTATGIVSFGGKDYYLINGKKTESMGATLVDGTWYFMAHGIVQKVTQLAEYQGEWFVVENGKIDISYNGLVPYDGAKFLVGAGRIQTEQTTLYNDGTNWYLISAGKVATEYTGAFTYDGQVFDVVAGIVK